MQSFKIVLATNGSQGVGALRELYALGFNNNDISILTFNSKFNQPFIEFLKFNKKEYTVIESREELQNYFKEKEFDILFSLSFRFIFSDEILKSIRIAAINFHPGILPHYKGSFSIPWAIINDEKYAGYTYHHMIEKVDSGQIIFQEKFPIEKQTAHTLNYLIFQRGISKLECVFDLILSKKKTPVSDDVKGMFYPNKLPHNGEINPDWSEDKIERFIRSMYFPPFESAFLISNGEKHYFDTFKDYLKFIQKK